MMTYFDLSHSLVWLGYSDFTGGFEHVGCFTWGVFTAVSGATTLSGANDGVVLERSPLSK